MAESFTREHIQEIRSSYAVDSAILERSIFALSLLEALANVGMPFIFKGGTSLLLLLEKPRRLSTDIDIIVEPGTDVHSYLEQAAKIYPFLTVEQQVRKGMNNIDKAHYKFTYDSPVQGSQFHILLDILYEENHYSKLVSRKVEHRFLITEEPYAKVSMPSFNCILGDKLTAFVPHTTGIPFGVDKELEIIKQLYDIATLIDAHDNFDDIYTSYVNTVKAELAYRGLTISHEEVLQDTIEASACIASRGRYLKEDYPQYLTGIRGIVNHIYGERFSAERAVLPACKTMYLAACLLKGETFKKISDPSFFIGRNIGMTKYAKLSSLRKLDAEAFAYVVQAIELLSV
ncbi:nucleotidyl transferase AbiEii/AbiGii toxin family protein [uncultured Sphaerochaeta sp.]|uniref:nucleotidyl transferase AbiEii/AbiGii toxin family protein n=1 Tax=uncultured Sphaerochaeta sp. TaxID=886478 RepID=UPI002A0A74A9|nr:nucleotidyl transferase AbiEii/AbiGii toxin family protein [uncultured Sphaerochaeta sp.]